MKVLGKRPREANTNLTRKNRLLKEGNAKRRKVQTSYRTIACQSNTIRRIRSSVSFPVYIIDAYMGENDQVYWYGGTTFTTHAKQAGYLFNIIGYAVGGPHTSHAISAYRLGDKLYVFDPWGEDRKLVSKVLARSLKAYIPGVKKLMQYNGPNLQSTNAYGACVGLSANFIILASRGMPLTNNSVRNTLAPRLANITKNLSRFENNPAMLPTVPRSVNESIKYIPR